MTSHPAAALAVAPAAAAAAAAAAALAIAPAAAQTLLTVVGLRGSNPHSFTPRSWMIPDLGLGLGLDLDLDLDLHPTEPRELRR